jgi:hypothetical protein
VAVNSSVKHAAEQAAKKAILKFRLNRRLLKKLAHGHMLLRLTQPPDTRASCVMKATLISNQEKYPFLRELGI